MTKEELVYLSDRISLAREAIIMDRPMEAEARLYEARSIIRREMFGEVVVAPREKMISRGLYRNRMPRMGA